MSRRAARTRAGTILAVVGATILGGVGIAAPAYAVDPPASLPAPDGLTEATAAASCWEIKQNTPSAPSGSYWLATPAMGGAQQFYCDQTGDGGGWVLIGRGREGWSVSTLGSGSPEQVRSVVTGPAAFTPRQLSMELIDQLANDEPIQELPDGIRLVRATNTAGTAWQNLSFKIGSPRDQWDWQFYSEQRVASYKIDGVSYNGGSSVYTSDFGRDNSFQRVRTSTGATEGWMMGWGFGSNVRGNPSATSYLWSKDTSTGFARPFTQVYIRPKLMSSDVYSAIPDSGTPAKAVTAVANGFALQPNWGVSGLGAGPSSVEGSVEVSAFTESGGNVYVGGNFTSVQRASGSNAQAQSYLAAFNRDTGEWVPGFRPTFNNQVKALVALPGGRIAAGGFFTKVNGEDHTGIVVLNATTGAVDPQWTGQLVNNLSGGSVNVRTLDVQGDWLYAGGLFTHANSGPGTTQRYARGAVRFNITTGVPDTWNPEFNATVMSLDASAQGDRVYFAGFFNQSQSRTAEKSAALKTTPDAGLLPWVATYSSGANYQQAVLEVDDKVWLGGSEHSLFSYDRDTFALESTTIGQNHGGDFQAIASDGHAVYAGCHCFSNQYDGATQWPNVGKNWTAVFGINATGAWSAADGTRLPEFSTVSSTRAGAGSWALFVDSTGALWEGGDFTYATTAGFVKQRVGGFVRHAQRDATPPSTPAGLTGGVSSAGVSLSWQPSTDDVGVAGYEVLRHDRVVATVTGTSVNLPATPTEMKYFVRAVDAAGNRSASTPALDPGSLPPANEVQTVIPSGSSWSYVYDSGGPSGDWTSVGYDASSWSTGAAPLGWGQSLLGTTLTTTESPKPLVSFYRKSFQVTDMTKVVDFTVTTRADDGLVLYVNGTEVKRVRVDDGPAGAGVYANLAVSASAALATPVTVEVPPELLVSGTNVISASVHSNYRATPSHSFELEAVTTISPTPVREEPAEPEDPPVDPEGPGDPEGPADPEEPVDPAPPATQEFIPAASTWSYLYDADGPSGDWTSVGYDASSWSTGTAPFGWGQASLGTTITTDLSPKPLTSFYRTTFDVADVSKVVKVNITTRADDGLVLYVNGTEVKRVNVDGGPDGVGVYANLAVSASSALANRVTVEVPVDLLVSGTNVITASVHSNYRATPSHSFELEAVATLASDGAE